MRKRDRTQEVFSKLAVPHPAHGARHIGVPDDERRRMTFQSTVDLYNVDEAKLRQALLV